MNTPKWVFSPRCSGKGDSFPKVWRISRLTSPHSVITVRSWHCCAIPLDDGECDFFLNFLSDVGVPRLLSSVSLDTQLELGLWLDGVSAPPCLPKSRRLAPASWLRAVMSRDLDRPCFFWGTSRNNVGGWKINKCCSITTAAAEISSINVIISHKIIMERQTQH